MDKFNILSAQNFVHCSCLEEALGLSKEAFEVSVYICKLKSDS